MSSQENKATSSSPSTTKDDIIDDIASFVADMASLCMNKPYSDVEFLVEGQRLPAHRLVLATRSEYIRAMLFGGMEESHKRDVPLEAPLEAFKVILRYLYTGTIPVSALDVDTIIDVLDLAHCYGLQTVETGIDKYLQQNLSVSNACIILDAARRNNLNERAEECLIFMDRNGSDIVEEDSFKRLSKESLEEVLRRDSFWAPEIDIFLAVCKWRDSNPSEDIKTVASLVRLPLLSVQQLLHVVRPAGIFELVQILDAIDQVDTGKNLPHRVVELLTVDVAHNNVVGKHLARRFKDDQNREVFELNNVFAINCIVLHVSANGTYHVEVSCDQTHWDRVSSPMHSGAYYFTKRPVRYIRIVKPIPSAVVQQLIAQFRNL